MSRQSPRHLFPTYYADRIAAITPEFVISCGCAAVLADIDNTLSRVDAPDASPEAEVWMERMRAAGIGLAFISNNDPPRVEPFAQKYGARFVCHAEKPRPDGYLKIAGQMELAPRQCLVVGDQLFTDILGGNAAGMQTVMVAPICAEEDPKPFRKRRRAEKLLLGIDRRLAGRRRRIGG